MANYVILGVEGDPRVYLVDLEHQLVSTVDPALLDSDDEDSDLARDGTVKGVDLAIAASEKLKVNAAKYPADKARGSSKKYSEL